MELMRVCDAARVLGCSETWLRRAETRGLIPKAKRDLRGWRVYTEVDISALREILLPTLPETGAEASASGGLKNTGDS